MIRKAFPLLVVLAGTASVVAGVAIGTAAAVTWARLRDAFADYDWDGVEDE